jgi:hypothetical protein
MKVMSGQRTDMGKWVSLEPARKGGKMSATAKIRMGVALAVLLAAGMAKAQPVTKLTPDDYAEIYNLYSAYSIALDTGNGAGRIATFTPDGTFSWVQSNHKPEDMAALKKRTDAYPHKKIPQGMMHILTNIRLIPTADGVNGSCYAELAPPTADSDGSYHPMPAYYVDKLVKTPQGWRFKSREVFMAYEWTKAKK